MTTPDPSSNEVLRLVALLRQQDQLLYKVSQCTTWEQMRPYLRELCDDMYVRMNAESDRIRILMIPQIREVYLEAAPQANPAQDRHPQPASPLQRALQEAIDVFEGMNDDEINVELLPRLRASLSESPLEQPAISKKEIL